jgi:diphthine synthase
MTLYLIGLGLSTEKDISLRGLEIIKQCDLVYLENYTSLLQISKEKLAQFYNKELILADRNTAETKDEQIIEEARTKDVTFLVIGDPFSATTHIQLFKLAKEKGVDVKVINNASILTSVGITGLELYKFGKTTSIPFIEDHPNLETPYNVLKENQAQGLHTLFLLDLKPNSDKFMTVNEAISILQQIEARKQIKLIHDELTVVGCARLGSDNYDIKSGKLSEILSHNFGNAPHCLIIPGKLHFIEEEMLDIWKL